MSSQLENKRIRVSTPEEARKVAYDFLAEFYDCETTERCHETYCPLHCHLWAISSLVSFFLKNSPSETVEIEFFKGRFLVVVLKIEGFVNPLSDENDQRLKPYIIVQRGLIQFLHSVAVNKKDGVAKIEIDTAKKVHKSAA